MDLQEGSSDCKQSKVVGTSYRRPEARSETTIPTNATKVTPQQTKVTVVKAATHGTHLSVPNHTAFISANAPTSCVQATPVIESALSGDSTPFAFSAAESADCASLFASHTAQTVPTTCKSVSPVVNSAISPIYPRGTAHSGGKGLDGDEVVAAVRDVAFWKVPVAGAAETSSCPSEQPSPVVLQQTDSKSDISGGGGVFSSGNQVRIAATRGRGLGVKITLEQREQATTSTTVGSDTQLATESDQNAYVPLTLSNPVRHVLPTEDDDIVIVKGIGKHVSRSEAYAAAARAVAASSASERSSSCVNTSASESEDTLNLKKESIARHATKASDIKEALASEENHHTFSALKPKAKEKKIFGNKKRTYEIPRGSGNNTSQPSAQGKATRDSGPTIDTSTSNCAVAKANSHQILDGDKKELTEQPPPQSLQPDNSNSSAQSTPKIRYGTAVEESKVTGRLGKAKNEPKNPRRQPLPLPEGHVEVPLVRPRYERKTRTTNQITVGDYASDSGTLGTVSDMIHQTSVEKLSIRHGDNYYEGTINFHTYSVFRHGARKIIARSVGYASEGDLVFHRFDVGEKSDSNNDSFAVIKRKTTEIHDAVCLDHRARRPMTDGEEEYLRKTKQINRKKNRKYPGIKAPKNKKIRQRLENDALTASSDFKLAFARAERRLAEERRERRKQRLTGGDRAVDGSYSSTSSNYSSDASLDEYGRLRPKARGTFQNVPPRYHKIMHQEEEKQNAYLESVGVSTNTMHHTSAAKATPVSGPVDPNCADARFSLLNTRLRDESKRALVSEYLTGLIEELDQDFTDYIRFSVPMVASQTPPFGPATPPYASILPPPGAPSSSGTSPTSLLGAPAFAVLPSAGSSFTFPTKTIADRSGFASRSSNTNAALRGNTQSLITGRATASSSVLEDKINPPDAEADAVGDTCTTNDSDVQKLPLPAAGHEQAVGTNPAPASSFASVTHAANNRVCSATAHSTSNKIGSPPTTSSSSSHALTAKQHYRFPSTPPLVPLTAQAFGGGGAASSMPTFLGEHLNQQRLTTPPSTTQIERVAEVLPDNAPPPLSYAFRDGYGRLICHAVATYYKLISTSEEDVSTGSRTTFVQFPESKRARALAMVLPSMPFLQYLKIKTRNHSAAAFSTTNTQMAAFAVGVAPSPTSSPIPSPMGMMVHANTMPPPLFEEEDENGVEGGQGCDYTKCPAAHTLIGGVDTEGQPLTKTAVKKLKKEIKLFELACSRGVDITQQQEVEVEETAVDEKAKRQHKKKRCSQRRNSKPSSQALD